jgi:hypothetical protein
MSGNAEFTKECTYCDSPRPVVHGIKQATGKWRITNLDGSYHEHNRAQGQQEVAMKKAYPDTAPEVPKYTQTQTSGYTSPEARQERLARANEIRVAHDENIQATKDKIAALDRNTDAINRVADLIEKSLKPKTWHMRDILQPEDVDAERTGERQ